MNADWLQAAHPTPAVVLRLKLRPYCLGHEILLQAQGCAHPETIEQLSLAVLICAQTYEAAARLVQRANTPLWFNIFLRIWKRLLGPRFNPQTELESFWEYRAQGLWCPERDEDDKSGRTMCSPGAFLLLAALVGKYNMTPSQALNFPLPFATGIVCAGAEADGLIKLTNTDEMDDLFAATARMEAEGLFDDVPDLDGKAKG